MGIRQNPTALKPESQSFGFPHSVVRRCRISENQDYSALEQEVLEFMLQSEDPDKFPSRKQLIEAGRRDLADAILRSGGWMTRGWDSVSDDELEKPELDVVLSKWDSIAAKKGQDTEKCELQIIGVENSEVSSAELKIPEICLTQAKELQGSSAEMGSIDDSSHPTASSSGRSVEIAADIGSGIKGILTGLENQRNWSLGHKVKRKDKTSFSNENGLHTTVLGTSDSCYPCKDEAMMSLDNATVAIQDNMVGNLRREDSRKTMPKLNGAKSSLEPYTWRTWSIQRASFAVNDFEAAKINFDSGKGRVLDSETDQINALKKGNKESLEMIEDLKSGGKYSGDKIKARLQNLELELSSALGLLKSNTDNLSHKVDCEHLPEDFRNLSDDWEFQENEIMKARDKLRTIRARLAVLEGKVVLAKIDTQKVIDEKKKRINNARKALKHLRSTCVIWPNSASEVFLTGSFDGWATQRKMDKLSNGTFCVWLRLSPGRYEMKFIVDGAWKVDPLRPIVKNNGNENNLLVIS